MPSNSPSQLQISVLGSGIVGLTTALEVQSRLGHTAAVTIVAESFPGDEKSIRFTSPWAGAHHVGFPGPNRQIEEPLERETFDRFWDVHKSDSEESRCFLRVSQREYFDVDLTGKTGLEYMPDFRPLAPEELVPSAVCGVAFTTLNIDTSKYLPLLFSRFLAHGGRVRRASVQHIDQILHGAWGIPVPDVLMVCPGIGARFLGGVEDGDMYPIRGQTVLIRAPWVSEGRTMRPSEGDTTYIVARPSGDVILGGTRGIDDWYPHPRPETARAILMRTLALMPDLIPPNLRDGSSNEDVSAIEPLIIEHGCGLRPGRRGGIRLERGTVNGITVVYNYGHGGAGYQMSWGCARVAVELLMEALNNPKSEESGKGIV